MSPFPCVVSSPFTGPGTVHLPAHLTVRVFVKGRGFESLQDCTAGDTDEGGVRAAAGRWQK